MTSAHKNYKIYIRVLLKIIDKKGGEDYLANLIGNLYEFPGIKISTDDNGSIDDEEDLLDENHLKANRIALTRDCYGNPDEELLDYLEKCYEAEYQKIDKMAFENFENKDFNQAYAAFQANMNYCRHDIEKYHNAMMMGLSAKNQSEKWYKKVIINKWLACAEDAFLIALGLCKHDRKLTVLALIELGKTRIDRFRSSDDNCHLKTALETFRKCQQYAANQKIVDEKLLATCESLMGETMFLLDDGSKQEGIRLMKSAYKVLKDIDKENEFENLSRMSKVSNLYKFAYFPRRMMLYVRQNANL